MSEDNNVLRINSLTGAVVATYPTGLANDGAAFGPDGTLYVADYYNNQIDHFSASGTLLSSFGAAELILPQGLTFGPDGNLYVTNVNSTVDEFSPTGAFIGTFITAGSGGLSNAKAIIWGPDGNAYVSSYSNSEVIRYNGTTGAFMDVFAAGGGGFEGIAFGPDGDLYAASYGNNDVYQFDDTGALVRTIGSAAELDGPFGVSIDPAGNLDVASRTSGTIETFDTSNGAFLGTLASGLTNPAYISAGNSSVYGEAVTLTATVSPVAPAIGTPTGTVTFVDGVTDLGTVALTGGTAAFTSSLLAVGSHDITVDYNGDASFAASTSTTFTQGVTPATLTVTANNATQLYGQTPSGFTDNITGFVNGQDSSVVSGSASLTTTATASSPVGNYTIAAAQGTLSAANYTFAFVNGTLTIMAAPLTVTANDASKTYGDPNPSFTVSYNSFVNGDSSSDLGGTLTFTTAADQTSGVGNYSVTPGGLTSTNYSITFANGTLTVMPATLTVTANDASQVYGQAPPTFTDTITGFVNGDSPSLVSGNASLTSTATASSDVRSVHDHRCPGQPELRGDGAGGPVRLQRRRCVRGRHAISVGDRRV